MEYKEAACGSVTAEERLGTAQTYIQGRHGQLRPCSRSFITHSSVLAFMRTDIDSADTVYERTMLHVEQQIFLFTWSIHAHRSVCSVYGASCKSLFGASFLT